jgi:hypothetical protein
VIDGLRRDKTLLLNANIQRNIPLRERVQLQLRLDAANVLNRSTIRRRTWIRLRPSLEPSRTPAPRQPVSSSS